LSSSLLSADVSYSGSYHVLFVRLLLEYEREKQILPMFSGWVFPIHIKLMRRHFDEPWQHMV
jgi:hypothetical protein